jgi:hypothetical protein
MALIKLFCCVLLLPLWAVSPLQEPPETEARAANAQAAELVSVRDRLMTSLFFRGQVADALIAAGVAGRVVDLGGIETNAGTRSALLAWIQKNPDKAAALYLHLDETGVPPPDELTAYTHSWEFNHKFIDLVKDLNAAASNGAVSSETLELAARRLYEDPQAADEGPEVRAGASSGTGFFSGNYAEYRLNKGGLERELAGAGAFLAGTKGPDGRGPAGLEKPFGAALAEYGNFVVAVASVKGRGIITAEESRGLEARRVSLRSRMGALALRARAEELGAALALLREPGAERLARMLAAVKAGLEASAERAETGAVSLGELGALTRRAELEFSAAYLRYGAYSGLLGLRRRAAGQGFSCLYDYALWRWLAFFSPGSAYPKARAALASGLPELDAVLAGINSGNLSGGAEGLAGKTAALEAALRTAAEASRFNRAAQFFQWGVLFRPVECELAARGGRPSYLPVFTFTRLLLGKK